MKTENLKEKLLTTISRVVGITGFSSLDFNEKADMLDKKEYGKSIEIIEQNGQINLTVSIIILSSVSAKGIVEEINQVVRYLLAKEKMTLGFLNIFIRGIE